MGFLRQHQGTLKPSLPIYIGGEECFFSREWTAPPVRASASYSSSARSNSSDESSPVKAGWASSPRSSIPDVRQRSLKFGYLVWVLVWVVDQARQQD